MNIGQGIKIGRLQLLIRQICRLRQLSCLWIEAANGSSLPIDYKLALIIPYDGVTGHLLRIAGQSPGSLHSHVAVPLLIRELCKLPFLPEDRILIVPLLAVLRQGFPVHLDHIINILSGMSHIDGNRIQAVAGSKYLMKGKLRCFSLLRSHFSRNLCFISSKAF